jgi:ParB family chromosome partitioning protein
MDVTDLLDVLALYVARAYSVVSGEPLRKPAGGSIPRRGSNRCLASTWQNWWEATPERYLNHVSKAKMVEAATDACGAEAARLIEKLKKGEAASAAAALLQGKRWLPSTLRPYPAPTTGGAGAIDNEEESRGLIESAAALAQRRFPSPNFRIQT